MTTPGAIAPAIVSQTDASALPAALLSPATGYTTGASTNLGAGNPTAPVTPPGYTPATLDAMAASVVAMYRSGQSSLVLRLDPPGMGTVSVHVALGNNANVNVLFVPSAPQTGHLLQAGLGDLRQAMATSGLILGQAQIGGGASGGAGGGPSGGNSETRHGTTSRLAIAVTAPADIALPDNGIRGARAIA
jgi:flagellar hook-length control protein FliK